MKRISLILFATLLGFLPPVLRAQEGAVDVAAIEKGDDAALSSKAFVTLDGNQLFQVMGVALYPADERAQAIETRLSNFAGNMSLSTSSLQIVHNKDYSVIEADGQLIMRIFDKDAELIGFPREPYTQIALAKMAQTILDYRAARQPKELLKQCARAVVATAIVALLFLFLTRLIRRSRTFLENRIGAGLNQLQSKSFELIRAQQIWGLLRGLMAFAWAALFGILFYMYIDYVLSLFPWTKEASQNLLDLLINPLSDLGQSFLKSLPGLMFVAVVGLLTHIALKMVRLLFTGIDKGTIVFKDFDPDWAWPTYNIVRVLILIAAVMVAYPFIPGSNSTAFKGVSLFIGVIISLGSSSFASNLIAGYSVIYRRAFKIGDRVKVEDVVGDVVEIKLLVTRLRSLKNEEIVIPNSTLINSHVTNYSSLAKEKGLILHTTVGIGYETPWRQVEAMLMEAANRTPGLLKSPPPYVLQKMLGDFCVTYEINGYCDKPLNMQITYTDLHRNILDLFNEYNVQIMTPAYEGDPAIPKVVPKERWFDAPASNTGTAATPNTPKSKNS